MTTTQPNDHKPGAECAKVPGFVLSNLQRNLAALREIRAGVDQTIQALDERMGGKGRYEADALINRERDISSALAGVKAFRDLASRNNVDAEAALRELGGVPDFTPSDRARAWMEPKAYATAGAALEAAHPFGYRSTDSAP